MVRFRRYLPSSGTLAVLLLGLVLGLQYFSGFIVLQIARASKESDLQNHLADLGRLAQQQLREPALALSDLALDAALQRGGDLSSPDPQVYQQGLQAVLTRPFNEFTQNARLSRVVLFTENGRVLYDTAEPDRPLQTFEFFSIDGDNIDLALRGEFSNMPPYRFRDELTQRFYAPVVDAGSGGQSSVVLCLVAGKNFLGQLDFLARRIRRFGLMITIMMGTIGVLVYSLTQRQRRMERQAAHAAAEADRLASLGTLAAGFAHELRNPLGIIRATTEELATELSLAESRTSIPADAPEICRDIIEEVDRMNRLVNQFLTFSRIGANRAMAPAPDSPPVTTLRTTIESVLNIAHSTAEKRGARLEFESDRNAPAAQAAIDPAQFKQILLNLLLNAIEAAPPGTAVRIACGAAPKTIELAVSDAGGGIPPEDAVRIFEPFYTTKTSGAGLGLAISRQLAVQAGGTLEIDRGHKPGARFVLTLPRAGDAFLPSTAVVVATTESPGAAAPAMPGRTNS